jgi:Uma2 family endonuclease
MSTLPASAWYGSEPAWEVALLFPPQGKWSVEEYLSLTDSINQFVEFSGGKIQVLPMPTIGHQRILVYLFMLLRDFATAHKLGEVLPSVFRIRVASDQFREPDIAFRRRENESKSETRYWNIADLVVEIVSDDPESHERDYVTKRRDYAAAGIPEYWIVDPQKERITVLVLEGGAYAVLREFAPGEQAVSRLLPGFSADVSTVFRAAEG